jgi:hypothetical protein
MIRETTLVPFFFGNTTLLTLAQHITLENFTISTSSKSKRITMRFDVAYQEMRSHKVAHISSLIGNFKEKLTSTFAQATIYEEGSFFIITFDHPKNKDETLEAELIALYIAFCKVCELEPVQNLFLPVYFDKTFH